MKTISPRDLYEQLQHRGHVPLIDVRTPVEFRSVHATPAKNVPLDQLSVDKATALVGEAAGVCDLQVG
ncbi:MAG: rhodanese-like domain-containing protein [Planctomycetaceae bacterium]